MNYMEQVAQMLGVELEEEFLIAIDGKTESNHKYKLTKNGCCHEFDGDWYHTESINRILSGNYEIVKIPKPSLDDGEREYLSAVIKPFRNRVNYIGKYNHINLDGETFEYIKINLKNCEGMRKIDIDLPYFKKNIMYRGMEHGKKYSLEELGL